MGHWGTCKIFNLYRVVLSFVRSQPLWSAILQVSAKVWCLLRLLCCCLIALHRNLRHSAFATQSCLLRCSWGFRPRPARPQMHPIDHAMSWGKKQAPAPEAFALRKLHIKINENLRQLSNTKYLASIWVQLQRGSPCFLFIHQQKQNATSASKKRVGLHF